MKFQSELHAHVKNTDFPLQEGHQVILRQRAVRPFPSTVHDRYGEGLRLEMQRKENRHETGCCLTFPPPEVW